jgi:hypothetical protein
MIWRLEDNSLLEAPGVYSIIAHASNAHDSLSYNCTVLTALPDSGRRPSWSSFKHSLKLLNTELFAWFLVIDRGRIEIWYHSFLFQKHVDRGWSKNTSEPILVEVIYFLKHPLTLTQVKKPQLYWANIFSLWKIEGNVKLITQEGIFNSWFMWIFPLKTHTC